MSDHPKPHPEPAHHDVAPADAGHSHATEAVKDVVKTVAAVAAGAAAAHHEDKHADHHDDATKKDAHAAPPSPAPVTKIIAPIDLPAMPPAIPSEKKHLLRESIKAHPGRSAAIGGITLAVAIAITAALLRKPTVEYPEGFVPYKMDPSASAPTPEPIHASNKIKTTGKITKKGNVWDVQINNTKIDENVNGYPATARVITVQPFDSEAYTFVIEITVSTPKGNVTYTSTPFNNSGTAFSIMGSKN